jgi:hypothetical protein
MPAHLLSGLLYDPLPISRVDSGACFASRISTGELGDCSAELSICVRNFCDKAVFVRLRICYRAQGVHNQPMLLFAQAHV